MFWNEEQKMWWMILAARENTSHERNGCTALCVSSDLIHWEYQKPLYSPHIYESANECPDLLHIGSWYYLIYSNYTDGFSTYYCMSRSLNGPWISPAVNTFDSRAFYAAKTVCMNSNYYIYGWNPTRGENNWGFDPVKDFGRDYKTWNWGGSIVVHQLVQHKDGTLGVKPIEALEEGWGKRTEVSLTSIEGNWVKENLDGGMTCESPCGYASLIGNVTLSKQCRIEASLRYAGMPERFGVALQVDDKFDFGYYLMFEPKFNRIEFRSGLRMYEQGGQMFPYATEMEHFFPLYSEGEVKIEIFIQDSLAVMYVNNDFAFGFRMYNYKSRNLGFFVSQGNMTVKDIYISAGE